MDKKTIQRKINRAKEHLASLKDNEDQLSKYGYWDMGYFEGKLSILEDLLDELETKKENH